MIEKVHGLQATALSMNDRFTILAAAAPDWIAQRPRKQRFAPYLKRNINFMNRNLIEQIARRLELQAKRFAAQQALRIRMGHPGNLRRFGSEGSLAGLQYSNSFGNLQGQSIRNRVSWRQSNGNINRSASFSSLTNGTGTGRPLRGFRRRGGGQRALRGRFRGGNAAGGRSFSGRITRSGQMGQGARVGQEAGVEQETQVEQGMQGAEGPPRPQVARRGTANRGRGRGGVLRNQTPPTKEQLDAQLDQYMAGTKAALDQELENYMKNAMELDNCDV